MAWFTDVCWLDEGGCICRIVDWYEKEENQIYELEDLIRPKETMRKSEVPFRQDLPAALKIGPTNGTNLGTGSLDRSSLGWERVMSSPDLVPDGTASAQSLQRRGEHMEMLR